MSIHTPKVQIPKVHLMILLMISWQALQYNWQYQLLEESTSLHVNKSARGQAYLDHG